MIFKNDKTYKFLKWAVITALPAFMSFLSVVLPAVGCPENVTHMISIVLPAFTALLGSLIGAGSERYQKIQEGK